MYSPINSNYFASVNETIITQLSSFSKNLILLIKIGGMHYFFV